MCGQFNIVGRIALFVRLASAWTLSDSSECAENLNMDVKTKHLITHIRPKLMQST